MCDRNRQCGYDCSCFRILNNHDSNQESNIKELFKVGNEAKERRGRSSSLSFGQRKRATDKMQDLIFCCSWMVAHLLSQTPTSKNNWLAMYGRWGGKQPVDIDDLTRLAEEPDRNIYLMYVYMEQRR